MCSFYKTSLCVFLLFTALNLMPAAFGQNRVVGYYPMWTRSLLPPAAVRYDLLTHIVHAFAWPDTDATLSFHEASVDTELINSTHRAGRKILLSFGGDGVTQTANFVLVTADTAKRRAFINNIVSHLTTYHYDGADIDWEWPQNAAERVNEAAFIRELRAAFNAVDSLMLITMAVAVTDFQGQWHDFAALKLYVDWFNALAFNFHGSWSTHAGHNAPLYAPATDVDGSVDQGIAYMHTTRGIPYEKLALGLSFFGRRFQAGALYGPKTEPTLDILYSDAVSDMASQWTYTWDSVSQVPYLRDNSRTHLDTFDDSTSLTVKCNYARARNMAGVMIWTLGQDLVQGREPMLEAVSKAMTAGPESVVPEVEVAPREYALLQNFPNPFNPTTVISSQLPVASNVKLVVYDLLGREVTVLVNERRAAGSYRDTFNGSGLASGVYFYHLTAGSFSESRTMVLIK